MKTDAPSLKDWKALYEATRAFKELKPWRWMSDADLFGVRNPESGEIGYCCTMGGLGEVFGMAVYEGAEGLDGYVRMQTGEFDPEDLDVGFIQKCLLVSFEDRAALDKEDLSIIKELGLKFRGRNQWPQFRSYLPGYVPWFLNRDQARFLATVMEQAADVAKRFKKDPGILVAPDEASVMVRCLKSRDKERRWQDVWVALPDESKAEPDVEPVGELVLRRVQQKISRKKGIWEFDYFIVPAPVREEGRPYYPHTIVVADASTGVLLLPWLSSPEKYLSELATALLNVVEESAVLPERVLVGKWEVFRVMEPIASELDFGLDMVEELETVEEFKEGLCSYMMQGV